MSTGLAMLVVEWNPGQWYWIRQSGFCPASCWDWREEDPDVYGPYASRDELWQWYNRREANTGGCEYIEYSPELHNNSVLAQCIASARSPSSW